MASSILITGASSGIGKAVAFELAKKGYSLALASREADALQQVRADIIAAYHPPVVAIRPLDVTEYDDVFKAVDEMAEAVDGLDIVFAKAGFAIYLEAVRVELFKNNIDVTVLYPGYIDTPLNNMLKNRPFLIPVEKGARIIAQLIEKRVKSSTVPVYPWNIVGRLMKILPAGMVARM